MSEYTYRHASIETLIKEMTAAAESYDDVMECSCSADDDGVCWYHLTDEEQRKWALDFIVDAVTPV